MNIRLRFLLPACIALTLTVAAGVSMVRGGEASAGLSATEAWARATPPGTDVGAAYVTIENQTDTGDRLLGITSPVAAKIEIHETVEEDGVARMRPIEDACLTAGSALAMRPGGTHLMLTGLKAPLKEGDVLTLTLTFETAGPLTVEAPIAGLGADAPPDHAAHKM